MIIRLVSSNSNHYLAFLPNVASSIPSKSNFHQPMLRGPSQEEITFAQMRMKLKDALVPYFAEWIQSPKFSMIDFECNITTQDGHRLQETIRGQSLISSSQFETPNGVTHKLELAINHTEGWQPFITLHSDKDNTHESFVVHDLDNAISILKRLIDSAFDTVCKSAQEQRVNC